MSRFVVDAANAWWEGHRPIRWTEEDHHANPIVNTTSSNEAALALEVSAAILRARRRSLAKKPRRAGGGRG